MPAVSSRGQVRGHRIGVVVQRRDAVQRGGRGGRVGVVPSAGPPGFGPGAVGVVGYEAGVRGGARLDGLDVRRSVALRIAERETAGVLLSTYVTFLDSSLLCQASHFLHDY